MSQSPWLDLGGIYRGIESVRQLWREWLTAWETFHFGYELVDAGDLVVVLLDTRMRGRATGIEVPAGETAFVTSFRNGRIFHNKLYLSHSEALEAVGLSGQTASSDPS